MTSEERRKHTEWLEKWKDIRFVREKATEAGIDCSKPAEMIHLFSNTIRVALMLNYPDPKFGMVDMQVWLARIPRSLKHGQ